MATWTAWGAVPGGWDAWPSWNGPGNVRYYLRPISHETGRPSRDAFSELSWIRVGDTLVKRDGVWVTVRNRTESWLNGCDYVFRGGYDNEVPEGLVPEITAAGFAVEERETTV